MKKIFSTLAIVLIAFVSRACYADFNFTNGCVGDTIFFQAQDGSAAYSWDYGDTTSGIANVSHDALGYHVYSAPGDYYVTLFVNVGAEWDYRTELIHVGNICFGAGFETKCNGSLYLQLFDRSYGAYTSQSWDFGDPASGQYNTGTALNPYHQFTNEGTYVITYIISDSINLRADTLVQSLYVDSTCLFASIPNITAAVNCAGSPSGLYGSFGGGVTNHLWDFGDPASGIANYSTALQPTHIYAIPGNYLVTLIYTNGVITDTIRKLFPVIDCNVWPGDANNDGEVSGEDIFPLGLSYSRHGNARIGASNNWSGQSCNSWNSSGFNFMYLQDLVDMKMADCNGDSVINELDVAAIQTNYGRKHTGKNNHSSMLVHKPTDPTLAVQLANSTVNAGSDIVATISLGDSTTPSDFIYGGSFTLLYDASKVDANAQVSFSLGWLDSASNLITFYHETYSDGKLEIAFVKTNNQNQSGYGPVATITFHTKPTATGAFDLQIDGTAKLFSSNYWGGSVGNHQEVFKDMYLQGASATFNTTGIANLKKTAISIFPNPSNGLIFFQREKTTESLQLELFNTLGEKVFGKVLNASSETETILLPEIANGLYQVSIKNESGTIVEKQKMMLTK